MRAEGCRVSCVGSPSRPSFLATTDCATLTRSRGAQYRVSLQSRWAYSEAWKAFWWARGLLYALAVLHVLFTAVASVLHLIIDFPLAVIACFDAKRAHKAARDSDGDRVDGPASSVQSGGQSLSPIPKKQETYVTWQELRALLWRSKLTFYYAALMCATLV
jgi:hypothetical protein